MKETIKKILKLSPIPLSKNHGYDILTKKIINQLPEGFNSIDVGCHKGEVLDDILKRSPQGQHYGIEALPDLYANLKQKYAHKEHVHIHDFAANEENGTISFNYVVSNPSYSGMIKRDYDKPNEVDQTITVASKKLDDVIPQNLHIHLIKIDVEGGELQVLKGAKNLITRCMPTIIFEHGLGASNHYETTPEKIFDFMTSCGLSIYNLADLVKGKQPMNRKKLQEEYYSKKNYYFVAR